MNCHKVNSKLADLLLDPKSVPVEMQRHVEECTGCSRDLAELRAAMGLLDDWAVPEANPFFDAKLLSRLRSEEQAKPLMAGALGLVVLIGGGTYADLSWQAHHPEESAAVRDLQSLDGNAQVFQQLDSIDQSTAPDDQHSGTASPSND
jgi:hypothetical protein